MLDFIHYNLKMTCLVYLGVGVGSRNACASHTSHASYSETNRGHRNLQKTNNRPQKSPWQQHSPSYPLVSFRTLPHVEPVPFDISVVLSQGIDSTHKLSSRKTIETALPFIHLYFSVQYQNGMSLTYDNPSHLLDEVVMHVRSQEKRPFMLLYFAETTSLRYVHSLSRTEQSCDRLL